MSLPLCDWEAQSGSGHQVTDTRRRFFPGLRLFYFPSMAKRFTDTNKFRRAFYRSLPGAYKLFWDFICADCDNSGIWIIDMDIAQLYVGIDMPIKQGEALSRFNSDETRVVEFDFGKKWFIPSFITFQHGTLSEKNNAHKSVIRDLQKYDFINPDLTLKELPDPLMSPSQGAKVKVMVKDKVMVEVKAMVEVDLGKSENPLNGSRFLVSQMHEIWKKTFPAYTDDIEHDYPACKNIADFIFKTAKITNGYGNNDEEIKILNTMQLIADQVNREPFWINKPLKSISHNIQEFYNKIKNPINGSGKKSTGKSGSDSSGREQLNKALAERHGNRKPAGA